MCWSVSKSPLIFTFNARQIKFEKSILFESADSSMQLKLFKIDPPQIYFEDLHLAFDECGLKAKKEAKIVQKSLAFIFI
jgi:hypothetical protein